MLGWRRRRRAERERGAVAVEAALVTPILFLLIFGMVEFGMFFKDYLAVGNSVRAGVRMASAEPRVGTFATDAAANVARESSALSMDAVKELWVYQAAADGTPVGGNNGFGACTECVKFTWDSATKAFKVRSDTWKNTEHNACQGDPGRMNVGVYMRYEHPSVTKFIFDTVAIADHAVMSFEPIPLTRGCK